MSTKQDILLMLLTTYDVICYLFIEKITQTREKHQQAT